MQTSTYGAKPKRQILIGIGANLPSRYGSPLESCMAALDIMRDRDIHIVDQSRWYKSAPVPLSDQPWFVNGVAAIDSPLDPAALLQALHEVENRFGRERPAPAAARTLDLDLLDYRGLLRDGPAPPELPHPRLGDRAFVLLPLAEIAPLWTHPRSGEGIAALIAALAPGQTAEPIADTNAETNAETNG